MWFLLDDSSVWKKTPIVEGEMTSNAWVVLLLHFFLIVMDVDMPWEWEKDETNMDAHEVGQ